MSTRQDRVKRFVTDLIERQATKEDLINTLCEVLSTNEVEMRMEAEWISFETELGPDFDGQIEVKDSHGRVSITDYTRHDPIPVKHYLGWLSTPVAWRRVRKDRKSVV